MQSKSVRDIAPLPGAQPGQRLSDGDVKFLNQVLRTPDLNQAWQLVLSGFNEGETWPPQFSPKSPESTRLLNMVVVELGGPQGSLASMLKNQYGYALPGHVPASSSTWQRLDALITQRGSAQAREAWAAAGGPAAAQRSPDGSANAKQAVDYLNSLVGGPDIGNLNPKTPEDMVRAAVNDFRLDGSLVRARVGSFGTVSELQLGRAVATLLGRQGLADVTVVFEGL